jgi:plasmid stabilization system protein ParE
MRVNVRPRFWRDLEEEAAYLTQQAGEEIAQRWAAAVWESVEELKAMPLLGRARLDLPFAGIRSWRVKRYPNWALFYAAREDGIVLYRVRHGAMNLPRLDFAS